MNTIGERVDRLLIWALFIWDIFPCMFLKLSYTRAEELNYLVSFYDTAMFFSYSTTVTNL